MGILGNNAMNICKVYINTLCFNQVGGRRIIKVQQGEIVNMAIADPVAHK